METKKRNIYFGKTFDCAINYQDHLIKIIVDEKDNMVNDPSIADIIIFSGTCACTQRQILTTVKSMINDLQKVKNRDNVTVYLTGCLTRPFRLSNDFFDNVTGWINENIDFVIPQNTPYQLLDLLYPHSEFEKWKNQFGELLYYRKNSLDLYISNGCNNRCSFCKINYQTWPLTSMPIEDVKEYIDYVNNIDRKLHLTFIGANISQYGYDLYGKYRLPEIIEYVEDKDNITSIGLGGFGVNDAVKFGFKEILRDSTKLTDIGGSLESGSNRILKLMNKGITIEEYIDFVQTIKSKKEKSLALSIIAGFPTETLEDVKMTLDALKIINPVWVDICRYVDSDFVPSHNYEQLPLEVIKEHARIYSKVLTKGKIECKIK
ncbi:MAG: radical SAM protein [Bacilli bacterium]|nr:radical SAM protein [Bacilli bacterium]